MNAPSQTLICNPQIEWSELLSSVSFRPFHVSVHPLWLCARCRCAFDREKMIKIGRKKKKRKKVKKHTNSIARIQARASPPAVIISFACLKLYHAAKETKYKIPSISEYYVTITRPTAWKRNTFHVVSNVNKGKKSEVDRANIFCRKKVKVEGTRWPFKTSQGQTFVM